jgi:hypothetical protein
VITALVPVKNQWHHTRALLDCLAGEPCRMLVLDNGSTDETEHGLRLAQHGAWRGRLSFTRKPDLSIYQLWNVGFKRIAAEQGWRDAWHVLVTNNDILLPPGALDAMRRPLDTHPAAWVSYPDYDAPQTSTPSGAYRETRGVLSDGGMFGACFLLAGHKIPWRPLVTDTTYEWWYGDNHLAEEIEQHGGKQIRVEGLPVQHVNEGTASLMHESDLWGMKYRDYHRWTTRYSR